MPITLLLAGAAPSMITDAANSEFLEEAINLVKSGSTLELRTDSQRAKWKSVTVKVTTGGYLIMDRQILGTNTAYATLPPDAAADLQELQILNLQRRPVFWGLGGSTHVRDDSAIFLVYLKTGTACYAYSQRGLFRVEVCS